MEATGATDAGAQIAERLRQAHAFAGAGRMEPAVAAFVEARHMVVAMADPARLAARVSEDERQLRQERDLFRACFAKGPNGAGRPLLIFADSLGLPRPVQGVPIEQAVQQTYSWFLGAGAFDRNVTPICQRFFTTAHVLAELLNDEQLGRGCDALIHVGLNDCASRMFLLEERLAVSLFDDDTQKSLVGFARLYRKDILRLSPTRHYVEVDKFRANLDMIGAILKQRGAGKVILTTIILPRRSSGRRRPESIGFSAANNIEIMEAAHAMGLDLFDADRVIWEALERRPLLGDGMHLSGYGHQLFANRASKI